MTYNLDNDFDRERFAKRCDTLLDKRGAVELTEMTARTMSQNRYLHLAIGIVAMETGVSLDYAKQVYYKRLANGDIYITRKHDPLAGDVEVVRSSAELTKEEMTVTIDRFLRWAAEQGIVIPDPDNGELILQAEIEVGKVRAWL